MGVDILAHICDLTTEFSNLTNKYGLAVATKRDPTVAELEKQSVVLAHGAAALWSDDEKRKRQESLLAFQKRLGLMRRVKWVMKDKKTFEILVTNLKRLNDGLRDILPTVQQRVYDRSLLINTEKLEILEILASDNPSRLDHVNQTYTQLVRFKKIAIKQARSIQGNDDLKEPIELNPAQVEVADGGGVFKAVLAKFDSTNVIVEYKQIEEEDRARTKIFESRLKDLVSLLQISPKPATYRVLDCKGYFLATETNPRKYGLVFSLPQGLDTAEGLKMASLHSLLRTPTDKSAALHYPLGPRLRLAALLASSVAALHDSGWLHHNITSLNIICLSTRPNDFVDIGRPYLSGFAFDLVDDPTAVSEISSRSGDNNYRHPAYQAPMPPGRKYTRWYELYSLGIVLIEIGLWRQIRSLRMPNMDARAFATHLREQVVPNLGFYMGERYKNAVLKCLEPERLDIGDDDKKRLSEAFSRQVVAELDYCQA